MRCRHLVQAGEIAVGRPSRPALKFPILLFWTVLASIVSYSCSASPPNPPGSQEQDQAALRALSRDWRLAARAVDVERYMSLLTEDVVVLISGHPAVTGASAVRTLVKEFFRDYRISEESFTPVEIIVCGEWAFDRGTYHAQYEPLTAADTSRWWETPVTGWYLLLARRQPDGSWKYARLAWQ